MDNIITIGICDDNRESRQQIEELINDYFLKESLVLEIHQFSSAKELFAYSQLLDLLYLDIELGDGSGVDLVPEIKKKTSRFDYYFCDISLEIFYLFSSAKCFSVFN